MNTDINRPRFVCFDPAEPVVISPPADDAAAQAAALAAPNGTLTQEQVNKILASEKRKSQAQITKIQETLETTLESKNLSQAERERMEQQLESIQNTTRTEKEKAKAEIDTAKKAAEAEKSRANEFQQRFYNAQIEQSITQAAVVEGAFLAPQLVDYLKPKTKMVPVQGPDGKFTGDQVPITTITVLESQGPGLPAKEVVKEFTPAESVRQMKSSPSLYGNFFKSGVVSGIGSGQGTTGSLSGGRIDVRSLSPQAYQEIRAKNPELLGLRKQKHHR